MPAGSPLVAQELGVVALIELGVRVLTATGDDLTTTEDPMKVAMRQIAGAFSQLEKARLVAKLKAARAAKKAATGKCEGRRGYAEAMPRQWRSPSNCMPKASLTARLAPPSRPEAI